MQQASIESYLSQVCIGDIIDVLSSLFNTIHYDYTRVFIVFWGEFTVDLL